MKYTTQHIDNIKKEYFELRANYNLYLKGASGYLNERLANLEIIKKYSLKWDIEYRKEILNLIENASDNFAFIDNALNYLFSIKNVSDIYNLLIIIYNKINTKFNTIEAYNLYYDIIILKEFTLLDLNIESEFNIFKYFYDNDQKKLSLLCTYTHKIIKSDCFKLLFNKKNKIIELLNSIEKI